MQILKQNKTAVSIGFVITLIGGVWFLANELQATDINEKDINEVRQTTIENRNDIEDLEKRDENFQKEIGGIKTELKAIKQDTSWIKKTLNKN